MNEKERYKLPISYPIVSSNCEHGYLLSGIQNNKKNWNWIMNNYIHQVLGFSAYGCAMDFFPMSNHAACPCIDYQRISKEFIIEKWDTAVQFLIECINKGYYVYILLNWFYIKASDLFEKTHFMHPTLVYGFDKIEKKFFTADFYENKKFGFSVIDFDAIEKAFKNNETEKKMTFTNIRYNAAYDAILYKNRSEFKYEFNKEVFIDSIEDYIKSVDVSRSYNRGDYIFYQASYSRFKTTFGLAVYATLCDYLYTQSFKEIDYKVVSVPLERTNLMIKRIDFLYEKNIINNTKQLKEGLQQIQKKLENMMNLIIKFNLTGNRNIINKICIILSNVEQLESTVYNTLLKSIK